MKELPKVLRSFQFFRFYRHVKASSRYSLVQLLPTSSSKNSLKPIVFVRFLCESESSLQSRAHFCPPHLLQVFQDPHFFGGFYVKSCALFVDHFPRSSETLETRTLLRRPRRATLPQKPEGFAPESVFNHELTRSRSLTLPNDLHDHVIAMMMWLT